MLDVELKTLHLTEPFRIAHGASSTRLVVRVREGSAVGEAPLVPYYQESAEETVAWLKSQDADAAQASAITVVKPTRAGRLALDLLRQAQSGVALGQRAEQVLGKGRAWGDIHACRSFSIPLDLTSFAEKVQETARQFRVLKLKLGSGDLDHDEAIVRTARAAAPQATLLADVNGGWSVEATVHMQSRLASYGLALMEQPIHHAAGFPAWEALKQQLPNPCIPLYADESTQSAEDVHRIAKLVQGVNVKLLKCASFEGAIEMIQAARQHGLGILLGCMIESSLGTTAAAHLAPWADYVDLDGHLYLADDDFEGITFDAEGRLVMPV